MGTITFLKKEQILHCLSSGEEKLIFDFDIIALMRAEVEDDLKRNPKYPFGSSFKKIILVKENGKVRFVAAKTFKSFHVLIAEVYSISKGCSDVVIGGGTHIRIDNDDGKSEKITIDGGSGDFGIPSFVDINEVISNFPIPVEIEIQKGLREIVEYKTYSYDCLHSMSTDTLNKA